jgi:hypothetical protein
MIQLDISDFINGYAHLNGQRDMVVSKFDIARAGMTIGYPKMLNAINDLGFFRFLELYFRTHAYIEKQNNYFQLKPVFSLLDSSERKTISYFLGQAFTKLFAEKYLDCYQVDNFGNHRPNVNFVRNNKIFVPKHQLYNSDKAPREPDLIGFARNGVHILEAKGYSSGFNGSVLQHAINQVSIINNVNGTPPLTKTACFFDLSGNPFVGTIIDPDTPTSFIDIEFEQDKIISNYYQMFNLEKQRGRKTYWELEFGDNKFAGFRIFDIMYPRYFFGVDLKIFEQINSSQNIKFDNNNTKYNYESYDRNYNNENVSIGPDGIILLKTNHNRHNIERKHWA